MYNNFSINFTGNENIWHGFIDIILSSHDGKQWPESSTVTVKCFSESSILTEKRKYDGNNVYHVYVIYLY